MPQTSRSEHKPAHPRHLRRNAAENHRPQSDTVHDMRPLRADNSKCLRQVTQGLQQTETLSCLVERNHPKSFCADLFSSLLYPGGDHDLEACLACRSSHRQKMRNEEPIFRNQIKQFWHYENISEWLGSSIAS